MQLPQHTHRFYIDGQWCEPIGRQTREIVNPATELSVATVAMGDAADIDRAVESAHRAFPGFATSTVAARAALLRAIIASIESRAEQLAQLVTAEIGSPIKFSRAFHVAGAVAQIGGMIETLESYEFERRIPGALIVREAIGVCGLIVPWNAPLALLAGKVATAIAAGCTIVAKPSELTPLSALAFAEAMHDAGVPSGVFNLVNGDGASTGQRLAEHPRVDLISITGSTRAGRLVAIAAAESIKRVHQELGGKSANIILPDANIEEVVPAGVARCYVGTGQSCQAPTRMLVHRNQHSRAMELAATVANGFSLGDPLSESTTMGPVVSKGQFDRVQGYIAAGVEDGARIAAGGLGRPENIEKGFFVRPTVFGDVRPDHRIAREEIFGPVLAMIPYDSEREAIEIANDSDYGLAGWVWSADVDRARAVARSLRTGRIYINGAPPVASAPFGGYRMSGNGRENGPMGLEEYLETKALLGY